MTKFFFKIIIINLFIIPFICYSLTENNNYQTLRNIKSQIEANYYTFNADSLIKILNKVDKICNSPNVDWHAYYYSGLLSIQIGKIYYLPNSKLAYQYFDKSIERLQQANKLNKSAENLALISCAYGKLSSLSTVQAIYWGIKAKKYIEEAYTLDKRSSKVFLIASIHLMHTPKVFGGDKDRARKLLYESLKINKTRKEQDDLLINWAGDGEIYAYIAQLEILLENEQKAQEYMNKALMLVPDYGFVKYDLAPQLKRIKNK